MGEEPRKMKDVKPPYIAFLMDKANKIYDAWDNDDPELALRRGCRLVFFLPVAIKDKLRGDVDEITKDINAVYGLRSVDFYTTHLIRTRRAYAVAQKHLKPFIDKMMILLDERGYLEIPERVVPVGSEY